MSDKIYLHKEHGLNPTIPVCWLCGEEKNEIALLGRAYNGQAPKNMIVDKNPCEKCNNELKQYVFFLITTSELFPEQNRTGEIIKLKIEAFKQIMNCELPPHNIAYCGLDLKEKFTSMMEEK